MGNVYDVRVVEAANLSDDTLGATARTRRNLAHQNLLGAIRFSNAVGRIEIENAGKEFGAFFDEIISNASACVLLSTAALEAYANQIFATPERYFETVPPAIVAEVWDLGERKSTLRKFDAILTLRSKPPMPPDEEPRRKASLLITLRNALVHFKPEWHDEVAEHARLSQKLQTVLKQGPHLGGDKLFPMGWMTHANTSWAVGAAVDFMQAFDKAADVEPLLDYSKLSY